MTADRNLPRERKALNPLDDSLLEVWKSSDGATKRAAEEIEFSRFWMDRMEKDVWRGDRLLAKALRHQGLLLALIHEVKTSLDEIGEKHSGVSEATNGLIKKIDSAMDVVARGPDEG